jgi:hypothetical protein
VLLRDHDPEDVLIVDDAHDPVALDHADGAVGGEHGACGFTHDGLGR